MNTRRRETPAPFLIHQAGAQRRQNANRGFLDVLRPYNVIRF